MSTCTKHFPPKNVLLDLDTLAVRKLSKSQLATL